MTQLRLFTVEDEHELLQLLAHLAQKPSPSVAETEPSDPAAAEPCDEEEHDRGGYWLRDWQDIVSEEVCVPRWGEI